MTAHSPITRLIFDQKNRKMKLDDMTVSQEAIDKDFKPSNGHSQDADRQAKISHQKFNKK